MDELKRCPFCGNTLPTGHHSNHKPTCYFAVVNSNAVMYGACSEWNTRPIEDELREEIEQFATVVENETGLLNDDELTPERLAEFLRCLNHQAEHASELIREKDAEIERLTAKLAYIESFVDDQQLSVEETCEQIYRFLKGGE